MKYGLITLLIPLLLMMMFQEGLGADFSDWENSGEVLSRFGEENFLKNSREWTQWAQERLLSGYYRSKGFSTEEKIHLAALLDWEKAVKEESKSYSTARFPLNLWKGYEFLSLTYTNLDFREQAFGVHFELVPGTLNIDQIIKRYGNKNMEVIDEGREKRFRFMITPGESLKGTPFGALQKQMKENDELWVDFNLRDQKDVRFVEVLTVKANPYRVPFTKNWNWDD